MIARAIAIALLLLASAPAQAVLPNEVLADPALESRARELSRNIRCLVCQNQSIDESNADLARDLRILVRERLKSGDSDQQILDFLIARYGDFILLRPRVKPTNYVLWFGPALVFAVGAGGLAVFVRRRRGRAAENAPAPLSDAERQQVESLSRDDPL